MLLLLKITKTLVSSRYTPSERVLTVWGNFADFIIAVKVMISVRSSRLQPVQSPFIRRIRCFCGRIKRKIVRSTVDFWLLKLMSPVQFKFLTCETAHASSGFSKRISENSIKTLHAAATERSWFLGTKDRKQTRHIVRNGFGNNICNYLMGDTYFDHILWWCSVPRAPQMMSRKARTVCHDEECQIHCRKKKEYVIKSCHLEETEIFRDEEKRAFRSDTFLTDFKIFLNSKQLLFWEEVDNAQIPLDLDTGSLLDNCLCNWIDLLGMNRTKGSYNHTEQPSQTYFIQFSWLYTDKKKQSFNSGLVELQRVLVQQQI